MNHGELHAWHYATRKPVCLRWREGRVVSLESSNEKPPENLWLAPALLDPQVNGYGGVDFQQDALTLEQLLSAARQLRRDGCARILYTLITDEWPKLIARVKHVQKLRDLNAELQHAFTGFHIEGPFLSAEPGFKGAHNAAVMRDATPADIQELSRAAGSDPVLITLAPERNGALDVIRTAASLGMKVSLGHTNASADVMRAAVAAGASAFTHLGNALPQQLDRHDNVLWRVFDTPGLVAGIIPDTIHVSPMLFRTMHRALPPERIYYTTDAMSAAGAPPGRYTIGAMELEVGADQIVRQPGKTNFAGSALKPIEGIFRAAKMLGCDWQDVWDHFSTRPAALMGLPAPLAQGGPADFCVMQFGAEKQLSSLRVYVCGEAPETV
ncbi:MAG: N-acetylglucosamine-6-phosphate deacetylase [Verrucomicrobia bacterium]|nr:N-acetylglucosamine-6-phosphate deacetylase [Verrucomicrobiota bacterium]